MNTIFYIGGIILLVNLCIGLACIAFAERGEKDTDLDASGKPSNPLNPSPFPTQGTERNG